MAVHKENKNTNKKELGQSPVKQNKKTGSAKKEEMGRNPEEKTIQKR
jgi:hypothetical protein